MELDAPIPPSHNGAMTQSATVAAANAAAGTTATAVLQQKAKKRTTNEEPKLPKLHSRLKFTKATIEVQRTRCGMIMANHSKTMFVMAHKICSQTQTLQWFDRTLEDKYDLNLPTQQGKQKLFIPKNIREIKMPLNHSTKVKKDSH